MKRSYRLDVRIDIDSKPESFDASVTVFDDYGNASDDDLKQFRTYVIEWAKAHFVHNVRNQDNAETLRKQ